MDRFMFTFAQINDKILEALLTLEQSKNKSLAEYIILGDNQLVVKF